MEWQVPRCADGRSGAPWRGITARWYARRVGCRGVGRGRQARWAVDRGVAWGRIASAAKALSARQKPKGVRSLLVEMGLPSRFPHLRSWVLPVDVVWYPVCQKLAKVQRFMGIYIE